MIFDIKLVYKFLSLWKNTTGKLGQGCLQYLNQISLYANAYLRKMPSSMCLKLLLVPSSVEMNKISLVVETDDICLMDCIYTYSVEV